MQVDQEAYEEVSETVDGVLRSPGASWSRCGLGRRRSSAWTLTDPEGFARALGGRGPGGDPADCTGGDRREQAEGQARHRVGKGRTGSSGLTFVPGFRVMGAGRWARMWGIGAKTAQKLAAGISITVGDLAAGRPDRAGAGSSGR